jgi:hypothetical protein
MEKFELCIAGALSNPGPRSVFSRICYRVAFARVLLVVFYWIGIMNQGSRLFGQEQSGYWKGELEVTLVSYDKSAYTRTYTYDVMQNPEGVVRHELIRTTSTASEQGIGIHIVDYQKGYLSVFDRGGSTVVRVPLVFRSARTSPLEDREILGFPCQGAEVRWVQKQNRYRRLRQIWTPKSGGFKDALLQLDYGFDATGKMVLFETRLMSNIKPSGPLPAELFKVPSGMQIITIDDP